MAIDPKCVAAQVYQCQSTCVPLPFAIANSIPVHESGTSQVTAAGLNQGSAAVDISHAHTLVHLPLAVSFPAAAVSFAAESRDQSLPAWLTGLNT